MLSKLVRLLNKTIPNGRAGLAVRLAAAFLGAILWTSAPNADEESDFKAKQKKRRGYNRHYAFKGRGRKEYFLQSVKDDRSELCPGRAACME